MPTHRPPDQWGTVQRDTDLPHPRVTEQYHHFDHGCQGCATVYPLVRHRGLQEHAQRHEHCGAGNRNQHQHKGDRTWLQNGSRHGPRPRPGTNVRYKGARDGWAEHCFHYGHDPSIVESPASQKAKEAVKCGEIVARAEEAELNTLSSYRHAIKDAHGKPPSSSPTCASTCYSFV